MTGGVHGYETSGVQGALLFLQAVHMQYTCRAHAVHMQYACGAHARHMHCTCREYAVSVHARVSLQTVGAAYGAVFNLLVVPCVSPWGYETVQRWNAQVVRPKPLVPTLTLTPTLTGP